MTVYVAVGSFACKCMDIIPDGEDKKRIFIDSSEERLGKLQSSEDSNTLIRVFTKKETDFSIERMFADALKALNTPMDDNLVIRVLSTMCEKFSSNNLFRILENLNGYLNKVKKKEYQILTLVIPTVAEKSSINENFIRFVDSWKSKVIMDYLHSNDYFLAVFAAEAKANKFLSKKNAPGFNDEVIKTLDSLSIPILRTPILSALHIVLTNFAGEYISVQAEFDIWLETHYPKYEKVIKEAEQNSIKLSEIDLSETNNILSGDESLEADDLLPPENEDYVFISYNHNNQQIADSFRAILNKNSIKTWMAPGDIPFGSSYTGVITRAVRGCRCLVVILSQESQESFWVKNEVERAINYKKTVLPIKIDDSDINDEFEIMISTSHIAAVIRIDENSDQIAKVVRDIKALFNNK